eukprot:7660339-Pyramimonas_sp.AAC.2
MSWATWHDVLGNVARRCPRQRGQKVSWTSWPATMGMCSHNEEERKKCKSTMRTAAPGHPGRPRTEAPRHPTAPARPPPTAAASARWRSGRDGGEGDMAKMKHNPEDIRKARPLSQP